VNNRPRLVRKAGQQNSPLHQRRDRKELPNYWPVVLPLAPPLVVAPPVLAPLVVPEPVAPMPPLPLVEPEAAPVVLPAWPAAEFPASPAPAPELVMPLAPEPVEVLSALVPSMDSPVTAVPLLEEPVLFSLPQELSRPALRARVSKER
jgi:hypothetical protein